MIPENQRAQAALNYLSKNHPVLAARIAISSAASPLGGLEGFFDDLQNRLMGTFASNPQVQQTSADLQTAVAQPDQTSAQSQATGTGILSSLLGPQTAVALYNIYRIQKGKDPVNMQDVAGLKPQAQAVTFLPYAIGAAVVIVALSLLK